MKHRTTVIERRGRDSLVAKRDGRKLGRADNRQDLTRQVLQDSLDDGVGAAVAKAERPQWMTAVEAFVKKWGANGQVPREALAALNNAQKHWESGVISIENAAASRNAGQLRTAQRKFRLDMQQDLSLVQGGLQDLLAEETYVSEEARQAAGAVLQLIGGAKTVGATMRKEDAGGSGSSATVSTEAGLSPHGTHITRTDRPSEEVEIEKEGFSSELQSIANRVGRATNNHFNGTNYQGETYGKEFVASFRGDHRLFRSRDGVEDDDQPEFRGEAAVKKYVVDLLALYDKSKALSVEVTSGEKAYVEIWFSAKAPATTKSAPASLQKREMTHQWVGFLPLSKRAADQHLVEGFASSSKLDVQDDIVDPKAFKAALSDFMKWANLREMHENLAAGSVLKCEPVLSDIRLLDGSLVKYNPTRRSVTLQDGTEVPDPIYIQAKVADEGTWKKITDGVLKGFSIGGKAVAWVMEKAADGIKEVRRITELLLTEVSVVDRPANPDARILMYKRDIEAPAGSEEVVLSNGGGAGLRKVGLGLDNEGDTVDIDSASAFYAFTDHTPLINDPNFAAVVQHLANSDVARRDKRADKVVTLHLERKGDNAIATFTDASGKGTGAYLPLTLYIPFLKDKSQAPPEEAPQGQDPNIESPEPANTQEAVQQFQAGRQNGDVLRQAAGASLRKAGIFNPLSTRTLTQFINSNAQQAKQKAKQQTTEEGGPATEEEEQEVGRGISNNRLGMIGLVLIVIGAFLREKEILGKLGPQFRDQVIAGLTGAMRRNNLGEAAKIINDANREVSQATGDINNQATGFLNQAAATVSAAAPATLRKYAVQTRMDAEQALLQVGVSPRDPQASGMIDEFIRLQDMAPDDTFRFEIEAIDNKNVKVYLYHENREVWSDVFGTGPHEYSSPRMLHAAPAKLRKGEPSYSARDGEFVTSKGNHITLDEAVAQLYDWISSNAQGTSYEEEFHPGDFQDVAGDFGDKAIGGLIPETDKKSEAFTRFIADAIDQGRGDKRYFPEGDGPRNIKDIRRTARAELRKRRNGAPMRKASNPAYDRVDVFVQQHSGALPGGFTSGLIQAARGGNVPAILQYLEASIPNSSDRDMVRDLASLLRDLDAMDGGSTPQAPLAAPPPEEPLLADDTSDMTADPEGFKAAGGRLRKGGLSWEKTHPGTFEAYDGGYTARVEEWRDGQWGYNISSEQENDLEGRQIGTRQQAMETAEERLSHFAERAEGKAAGGRLRKDTWEETPSGWKAKFDQGITATVWEVSGGWGFRVEDGDFVAQGVSGGPDLDKAKGLAEETAHLRVRHMQEAYDPRNWEGSRHFDPHGSRQMPLPRKGTSRKAAPASLRKGSGLAQALLDATSEQDAVGVRDVLKQMRASGKDYDFYTGKVQRMLAASDWSGLSKLAFDLDGAGKAAPSRFAKAVDAVIGAPAPAPRKPVSKARQVQAGDQKDVLGGPGWDGWDVKNFGVTATASKQVLAQEGQKPLLMIVQKDDPANLKVGAAVREGGFGGKVLAAQNGFVNMEDARDWAIQAANKFATGEQVGNKLRQAGDRLAQGQTFNPAGRALAGAVGAAGNLVDAVSGKAAGGEMQKVVSQPMNKAVFAQSLPTGEVSDLRVALRHLASNPGAEFFEKIAEALAPLDPALSFEPNVMLQAFLYNGAPEEILKAEGDPAIGAKPAEEAAVSDSTVLHNVVKTILQVLADKGDALATEQLSLYNQASEASAGAQGDQAAGGASADGTAGPQVEGGAGGDIAGGEIAGGGETDTLTGAAGA